MGRPAGCPCACQDATPRHARPWLLSRFAPRRSETGGGAVGPDGARTNTNSRRSDSSARGSQRPCSGRCSATMRKSGRQCRQRRPFRVGSTTEHRGTVGVGVVALALWCHFILGIRSGAPSAQHRTAPHSTAQHRTAPHSTAQHRTSPCSPLRAPPPSMLSRHAGATRPSRRSAARPIAPQRSDSARAAAATSGSRQRRWPVGAGVGVPSIRRRGRRFRLRRAIECGTARVARAP